MRRILATGTPTHLRAPARTVTRAYTRKPKERREGGPLAVVAGSREGIGLTMTHTAKERNAVGIALAKRANEAERAWRKERGL